MGKYLIRSEYKLIAIRNTLEEAEGIVSFLSNLDPEGTYHIEEENDQQNLYEVVFLGICCPRSSVGSILAMANPHYSRFIYVKVLTCRLSFGIIDV